MEKTIQHEGDLTYSLEEEQLKRALIHTEAIKEILSEQKKGKKTTGKEVGETEYHLREAKKALNDFEHIMRGW